MLIFGIIVGAAIIVIVVLITEKKGDPGDMESYYRPANPSVTRSSNERETPAEPLPIRHIDPTRHTLEKVDEKSV